MDHRRNRGTVPGRRKENSEEAVRTGNNAKIGEEEVTPDVQRHVRGFRERMHSMQDVCYY